MTTPRTDRPRCSHCGQLLRQYKQRAYPTRDKVVAFLQANGPANAHKLAAAVGVKYVSIARLLREYADQGYIERKGLEPFTEAQTIRYGSVSKRPVVVTMTHYRTLWGLPDATAPR